MKYRLAVAVKECMQTTAVDRITIKEIVETAGTTRQTFYRHFQDKYDLINWYFDKLLVESFRHIGTGKTVQESLKRKFDFIVTEKVFFAGAFRSDDYNSLKEHDFEEILKFFTRLIEEKTGKKLEEELKFLLEMYCQGAVYMTVKWVTSGAKSSPEDMAKSMVDAMPQKLSEVMGELGLM